RAGECADQAGSWDRPRRVVCKAAALAKGPHTRFVGTNRPDPPLARYDCSVDRGEPENWVKAFTRAGFADRLRCCPFLAHQCRCGLHAAAYPLLAVLRRRLRARGGERLQLDTLRLRLLQIGGGVKPRARDFRLRLASSHPGEALWALLAARPLAAARPS